MNNLLIKGDNIEALRYLLEEKQMRGKVSLIYIDPPFATGASFSIDDDGRTSTISRSHKGSLAYADTLKGEAFIAYLRERIELMYELLSENGSFYLHIDYKIGHYIKVMLDQVFGIDNFRNDITRIKCNPKNFSRLGYGNVKDMILFYTKSNKPIWNEPRVAMSDVEIKKLYSKQDTQGRYYTTVPIHAPGETKNGASAQPFKGILPPPGRHWRCSVEELERLDKEGLIEWSKNGVPRKINFAEEHPTKKLQDVWEFKDPQYPIYPTEKNHDLLKTIINASSNPESIVLDCFAGSGGTLVCAAELGRKWIGVDISALAIQTIQNNLSAHPSLFSDTYQYEYIDLSD